jgi:hypothetical protein
LKPPRAIAHLGGIKGQHIEICSNVPKEVRKCCVLCCCNVCFSSAETCMRRERGNMTKWHMTYHMSRKRNMPCKPGAQIIKLHAKTDFITVPCKRARTRSFRGLW